MALRDYAMAQRDLLMTASEGAGEIRTESRRLSQGQDCICSVRLRSPASQHIAAAAFALQPGFEGFNSL